MKTLLTGKPYTNSAETDLKKTFSRIRRQLAAKAAAARRDAEEAERKTVPMRKKA